MSKFDVSCSLNVVQKRTVILFSIRSALPNQLNWLNTTVMLSMMLLSALVCDRSVGSSQTLCHLTPQLGRSNISVATSTHISSALKNASQLPTSRLAFRTLVDFRQRVTSGQSSSLSSLLVSYLIHNIFGLSTQVPGSKFSRTVADGRKVQLTACKNLTAMML